MSTYTITTEAVHGGFDLIVSDDQTSSTLFIHDKSQAIEIGERIITIAKTNKIDINSATGIFNQGMGMFNDPNSVI